MSSFLPDENIKEYFSNIEILQVLDEYDGPIVFSFLTQSGDFFLSYLADRIGKKTTWLYFPTDPKRLKKLIKNQVTIKEFFKICGHSFLVEEENGVVLSGQHLIGFDKIDPEYVPDDDVKLDIDLKSITLKINKPGINLYNVTEKSITDLLTSFRSTIKNTMKTLKDLSEEAQDELFSGCPSSPKHALAGIDFGSVEVTLLPIEKNKLVDESLISIGKVAGGATDGMDEFLVKQIKSDLYQLTPNKRSRHYESVEIFGDIFDDSNQNISIILNESHRDLFRERRPVLAENVTLSGKVDTYSISGESFTIIGVQQNDLGSASVIKCDYEPELLDEICKDNEDPWTVLMNKRVSISGNLITPKRMTVTAIELE